MKTFPYNFSIPYVHLLNYFPSFLITRPPRVEIRLITWNHLIEIKTKSPLYWKLFFLALLIKFAFSILFATYFYIGIGKPSNNFTLTAIALLKLNIWLGQHCNVGVKRICSSACHTKFQPGLNRAIWRCHSTKCALLRKRWVNVWEMRAHQEKWWGIARAAIAVGVIAQTSNKAEKSQQQLRIFWEKERIFQKSLIPDVTFLWLS